MSQVCGGRCLLLKLGEIVGVQVMSLTYHILLGEPDGIGVTPRHALHMVGGGTGHALHDKY